MATECVEEMLYGKCRIQDTLEWLSGGIAYTEFTSARQMDGTYHEWDGRLQQNDRDRVMTYGNYSLGNHSQVKEEEVYKYTSESTNGLL